MSINNPPPAQASRETALNAMTATVASIGSSDVAIKCYRNLGNAPLMKVIPRGAREFLDVGCGSGVHAEMLAARGFAVDGITLSPTEHANASQSCRSCWIHDLEDGLPSELARMYDVILCSHVLEHLRWPDRTLRSLRPFLAPREGRLLVALPNVLFYKNRARLLSGYFEYEEAGLMDASHFRWFSYDSARRLVEQCGYQVLRHFGDGSAPLPLIRRYLPKAITTAVDGTATKLFPGLCSWQIIVVAARQ